MAWGLVGLAVVVFVVIMWGPEFFGIGGGGDESSRQDTPVSVALGEVLFQKNCASCHGVKAVGENPARRMGGEKAGGGYIAPALNGTGHAWHHPPDMLFRIVKEGSPAKGSTMTGWKGRMTDGEIRSVLAFMKTLWPEQIRNRYEQNFK